MRIERSAAGIFAAVFISGAVLLGLELVASRVVAPFFGSSIFVWGALIGVVLAGLSVGYWIGGVVADRFPTPLLLLGALDARRRPDPVDPGRRRLGARARRPLGPGPALEPARGDDRALRAAEHRPRHGHADRRPPPRAVAHEPGQDRRAALRRLDRREHRRHLRHGLLPDPGAGDEPAPRRARDDALRRGAGWSRSESARSPRASSSPRSPPPRSGPRSRSSRSRAGACPASPPRTGPPGTASSESGRSPSRPRASSSSTRRTRATTG